jgi:hypothetical protein
MKIVVYACVPTKFPIEGFVRRARVTMEVPSDLEKDIYTLSIEYLQGSLAHRTCHHEQSLDPAGQLTLPFLVDTMLLDDGPQEGDLMLSSDCVINGKL